MTPKLIALSLTALTLALTACGSDDSSSTVTQAGEHQFTPRHHRDPASGPQQFEVKGGDNSIQTFGHEGSGSEYAEAAEALHGYLDARAARAWDASCGYLAPTVRNELGRQITLGSDGGKPSCSRAVAALSALPATALREAAVADIAALRVKADYGFILFNGPRDSHYFVAMKREKGRWWVAAPAPSPLP
jgi:hypothetical protein